MTTESAVPLLLLRAALLAGASPTQAVGALPPDSATGPLRALAGSLGAGRTLEALAGSGVRDGGIGPVVRALAVAEASGASAAPALDGLLDAVSAAARLERLVRARSAQARLTARFLIALPVVAAGGIGLLDPGAREFLVSGPGIALVALAAVLIGLAALWIGHLVRGVRRAVAAVDPVAGDSATLPTVESLDLLAVALAGGLPLSGAADLVGRLGPPEVRHVWAGAGRALLGGVPADEALPDRLRDLAHVLAIGERWGAPSAGSVRLLTRDLRERAASAADDAAERLTVLLVFPTTLLLVPAFGLLVVVPMVASALSGLSIVQ